MNKQRTRHSIILTTRATALGIIFLTGISHAESKPAFDCSKASGDVEELICNDTELADLDRSLSDLYGVLYKNLPADQQKHLKAEQIGWIKGRNDCWKSDDLRACVKGEYEYRINQLKDR